MANTRRPEDEEGRKQEAAAKELTELLESFTKEQLIDILLSVAAKNTKIIEEIHKRADQNPSSDQQQLSVKKDSARRKIFVGNVSANSEITAEKLHKFFSKFGEIQQGPLGFDKDTGKPKGYALFIYKTAEGARKALEKPTKNFNGHILHCAIATGGGGGGSNKQKSGTGSTDNLMLKNNGYDSAATAPTTMQSRAAGASEMNKSVSDENSQSCTSQKIGPSVHGNAKKPASAQNGVCLCVACVCYYLKQFVLFFLCLLGVFFLLSRVF